jgi:hypothetical protein
VKYGNTCKAVDDFGEQGDLVLPEIVHPDGSQPDTVGEIPDAHGDGVDPDSEVIDDTLLDVSYDVSWPGGLVGKPCNITTQCEMEGFSTTCLGWSKKGYCTIKDCGDGTTGVLCPDGSLCMGVSLKQPVCIQSCASDADCRVRDGFACKLMPDASGAMQSICHEVDVPGATGDGCLSASECAGEAGCLATFPGGYCTLLSCKDVRAPAALHAFFSEANRSV